MLKWTRVAPHHAGIYTAGHSTIIRMTEVSSGEAHWLLTTKSEFKTLKSAKEAAQEIMDNGLPAHAIFIPSKR